MNAQLICVDHINRIIEEEEVAVSLDLGSIRVIRDHDDQCDFLNIIALIAPEDLIQKLR